MSRIDAFEPPVDPVEAYDEFWTATEAGLDVSPVSDKPTADPSDTYAAFHAAADE